ncbi:MULTISPECIES: hypothetical protein [Pseudomonas syringae group]|uniref:hypothetical protein n=1 Tax=Pseudomonas syringae group TaxID=136849 RepID=UPI000F003922|nr:MULTISPECIES: hypothetical protein [Pseudomonas syringae group]MDH4602381.1 hypothetical protein [Pseudomonas syringae pv. papulans]
MNTSIKSAVLTAVVAASALASGMTFAADQTADALRAGSATVDSGYVQRASGGVQHAAPSDSFVRAHENDVRFNASVTDHNQNG